MSTIPGDGLETGMSADGVPTNPAIGNSRLDRPEGLAYALSWRVPRSVRFVGHFAFLFARHSAATGFIS